MAPINSMSVLAFATAALAVPFQGHGGHGHAKYHNNKPSGFSAYPYPSANGTGIYPTGTGFATASSAPIAPVSESAVVSDVEMTTAVQTTYADASTTCTSDVTVTTTVKKTVTVTPSAAASSEAAPLETSSEAVVSSSESSAPAYSEAPTSYSSKAEAVTQETESAPAAYSSPATTSSASSSAEESSAAQPTLTYAAANKNIDLGLGGYGSSSSSSAAPSSTGSSYGSSSGKSGKRGVAYNDSELTKCLVDSPAISWGYNWGATSSGLSDSVKFIPTMWGLKEDFMKNWSDDAKDAIKAGSDHLFSFNEPDLQEQSGMTPEKAAEAYKTYMEPFSGKAKLCAPSVTNGGDGMGLDWLSKFLSACSDCTIDCLNIHWYDSAQNVEYFKKHVNDAADLASGKDINEIFISEFAATGSDDQISEFLETVMPWMDDNDKVAGYAYFMAGEGKLVSGNEQSAIGKTYASS